MASLGPSNSRRGLRYAPPLEDTEIVAQDFVRAMERELSPAPPSYPFSETVGGYFGEFFVQEIAGAEDYVKGKVDNISGMQATDDHTLVLHLTEPTGDMGYRMSLPPTAPIPPNPSDPSARFGVAEGHDEYGLYQVSSGPYMIEGAEELDFSLPPEEQPIPSGARGFTFTLVRNPSWDPASDLLRAAKPDRIVLVPASDPRLAGRLIEKGDLDLIFDDSVPGPILSELRSDPATAERIYTAPRDIVRFISMRVALPPFDDLHVRKAVNYAVDKHSLLDIYEQNGAIAAPVGHIAPDSEENNLLIDYDPYGSPDQRGDIQRARAEMKRSRYDRNGDGSCDVDACKDMDLLVRSDLFGSLPESFRKRLAALGMTYEPRLLDGEGFFEVLSDPSNKVPIWVGDGWVKDYPNASTFFPPIFSGGENVGVNNWSYVGATPRQLEELGYGPKQVPSVDDRIDECQEMTFQPQVVCWAQLDQYMMENVVPWVPLLNEVEARIVSDRVETMNFDQFASMPALERVALTPEAAEGPAPLPTPSPASDSDVPEGVYQANISTKDAARNNVRGFEVPEITGPIELTLEDGYFQIEYVADRPYFTPRILGIYEGAGDRVTFRYVTPSFLTGNQLHMRWQRGWRSVDLRSREWRTGRPWIPRHRHGNLRVAPIPSRRSPLMEEPKLDQTPLPPLPTGTVTFLFTDIEGSTALVRQLGDRWAEVREEHRRLLREQFREHRGIELGTEGDSFFVAFSRATDAIAAAVGGQVALAAHQWPEGAPVKVRMGLHTGEVQYSDETGYSGLPVHEAARVANAAHGGQILVSKIVHDLVGERLRDPVALRDLGAHRLKDISLPQRIFQVTHPDLDDHFEPIRTLEDVEASTADAPRFGTGQKIAAAALAIAVVATVVFLATRNSPSVALVPNSVAILSVEGEAEQVVGVGADPSDLAVTDEAVWVANFQDGTVSAIDRADFTVLGAPSADGTPTDIVADPDNVWVANGFDGTLQRIDAGDVQVVASIEVGNGSNEIAVGEGGVWIAEDATERLSLIDPTTNEQAVSIPIDGSPTDVAVGGGSIWVAQRREAKVLRISPDGETMTSIGLESDPHQIVYGEDQVWTVNSSDDTVSRIDPASNRVAATIDVGDEPTALAIGQGAVWVTNGADASLVKIDPSSNEVADRIELDHRPTAIAVVDGRLWVTLAEST